MGAAGGNAGPARPSCSYRRHSFRLLLGLRLGLRPAVRAQPVLEPGESFDYVSGCTLDTPEGSMRGTYRMVDENGESFDIEIPKFELLSS